MNRLQNYPDWYDQGQHVTVTSGDLKQVELGENDTTIYADEIPQDKRLHHGHGGEERDHARAKFWKMELVASGNGAGTAGDVIDAGDLIGVITDSKQRRVEVDGRLESIGELQEAVTDDRTDRPMVPAQAPRGSPGKFLEYRVDVPAKYVGYEVDPAASTARLYHTEQG